MTVEVGSVFRLFSLVQSFYALSLCYTECSQTCEVATFLLTLAQYHVENVNSRCRVSPLPASVTVLR
jgi:cytochrome oxidase Cu insertion factor (SCO1/SenC/PrrC family)